MDCLPFSTLCVNGVDEILIIYHFRLFYWEICVVMKTMTDNENYGHNVVRVYVCI